MHDYIKQVHIKEISSKTLTVDTKFESAKKLYMSKSIGIHEKIQEQFVSWTRTI